MKRATTIKLCVYAALYAVLGNVLSLVVSVSLAAFTGNNLLVQIGVILLSAVVFYSLMFTVGYNDGLRERKMLQNHRVESVNARRWLFIGAVVTVLLEIVSLLAVLGLINIVWFRFIFGAVFELVLTTDAAWPAMIFYLPIAPVCYFGFTSGLLGRLDKDKIMYE